MDARYPRQPVSRQALLALGMLLAIGTVAVMGMMDEHTLSTRVRVETSREQRVLASLMASEFHDRLAALGGSGPPLERAAVAGGVWSFNDGALAVEPRAIIPAEGFSARGEHRLVLWSTAAPELRTLTGEKVFAPSLAAAVAADDDRVWLPSREAAALDLPDAPAVAGLARFHTHRLGDWVIAVISSIEMQRLREARRYIRTVVMVGLASLVAIGFGLAIGRHRRQARALLGALACEDVRRGRETRLTREGRMASLLTFATGIVHELSPPLGVIAARAEELAGSAEDDRTRRSAHAIIEQIRRIRDRMDQFVVLARGATPPRERCLAVDVIADAVGRSRHRFDRAGVALVLSACEAPRWIRGDTRLLEHALTNLLLNACDASPPGGVVELSVEIDEAQSMITVRDRGAGIGPFRLPGHTALPAGEAGQKGSGLGLAIAGEVMRMHRGELVIEARPGGGTCASLCFPSEGAHAQT
jgi:two-component system, NtrC family, sensor kinase